MSLVRNVSWSMIFLNMFSGAVLHQQKPSDNVDIPDVTLSKTTSVFGSSRIGDAADNDGPNELRCFAAFFLQ